MEQFTLNTIAAFAKVKGFSYLKGQYLSNPKNEIVKQHYFNMGFEEQGDHWILDTRIYAPKKTYVKIK